MCAVGTKRRVLIHKKNPQSSLVRFVAPSEARVRCALGGSIGTPWLYNCRRPWGQHTVLIEPAMDEGCPWIERFDSATGANVVSKVATASVLECCTRAATFVQLQLLLCSTHRLETKQHESATGVPQLISCLALFPGPDAWS